MAAQGGHDVAVGRLIAKAPAAINDKPRGRLVVSDGRRGAIVGAGRLMAAAPAGGARDWTGRITGGAALYLANSLYDGGAALYLAAQNGHESVVGRLIAAGAAVGGPDDRFGRCRDQATADDGSTPLSLAAQNGHEAVVGRLTAAGAAVRRGRQYDEDDAHYAQRLYDEDARG